MTPTAPVPVQPVLRGCLHLLVLALLGLAVARAVAEDAPHAGAVLAAAVAVGLIYAVGPALPSVQRSTAAAAIWLTILGLGWLVLLYWTPDGIWLAFPLFFVQLHLLPMRWGLTAVATTTVAAIAGFAWHQDGLTAPMVLGPVLGAAVAVATVLGYQALYRESEARRRLIDELTAARADLAAAEHTGGVLAERERLAREIHDTLAQGLSSIQLLLRAAERALPGRSDSALGHVRQARQAAVDVIGLSQTQGCAGVGDGGQDLGPVAHDRGVTQQAVHVLVPETGHHLRVETGEGVPEGRPLAQDRGPGQARLEGLQAQPLEDSPLVAHRHAPLGVVVLAQQRVGGRPSRPGQTVVPHH